MVCGHEDVRHPWLKQVFAPSRDISLGTPRWSPPTVTNLADQHRYFAKAYPGARVLMQVGKHWLLAGACPSGLAQGQTVQRPGLGPCTEWPLAALALLRQQLRARGIGHQVVSQTGHFKTGFKHRTLTAVWLPPGAIGAAPAATPFSIKPNTNP